MIRLRITNLLRFLSTMCLNNIINTLAERFQHVNEYFTTLLKSRSSAQLNFTFLQ